MCDAQFSHVWAAAQSAIINLGGRVVSASELGGMILGELILDTLGSNVELYVRVDRPADHHPGVRERISVNVKAVEKGVSEPDQNRLKELIDLEKRYLALVHQYVARVDRGASCGSPMGGG
jgi:hypothetical protein